jgi:transcriptional regulator with XRE-family HTH domain
MGHRVVPSLVLLPPAGSGDLLNGSSGSAFPVSITSEVIAALMPLGYGLTMTSATMPVGNLIRDWRQRRRLSQLALALDADVSARHVSFLETGRSQPSRDMLMRLAESLEIPLRDRNALLVAGGYAPVFPERSLDTPEMQTVREAVDRVLRGHEPYPAIASDRYWQLVAFNQAVAPLLETVSPELLAPPVNVLRLSLHPDGLAERILNFSQWKSHLLARLQRQVDLTADTRLAELRQELAGYRAPDPASDRPVRDSEVAGLLVPLRIRSTAGVLTWFSTTTVFGTPVEVTLSELAIESFFPADRDTTEALLRAEG